MPKVGFLDQARASIFYYQNLISLKIVVHNLFGVLPKDLKSMLCYSGQVVLGSV